MRGAGASQQAAVSAAASASQPPCPRRGSQESAIPPSKGTLAIAAERRVERMTSCEHEDPALSHEVDRTMHASSGRHAMLCWTRPPVPRYRAGILARDQTVAGATMTACNLPLATTLTRPSIRGGAITAPPHVPKQATHQDLHYLLAIAAGSATFTAAELQRPPSDASAALRGSRCLVGARQPWGLSAACKRSAERPHWPAPGRSRRGRSCASEALTQCDEQCEWMHEILVRNRVTGARIGTKCGSVQRVDRLAAGG